MKAVSSAMTPQPWSPSLLETMRPMILFLSLRIAVVWNILLCSLWLVYFELIFWIARKTASKGEMFSNFTHGAHVFESICRNGRRNSASELTIGHTWVDQLELFGFLFGENHLYLFCRLGMSFPPFWLFRVGFGLWVSSNSQSQTHCGQT